VPLFSPRGARQTLRAGRRYARLALTLLVLIFLAPIAVGILLIDKAGFLLLFVAAFLAWKVRPGFRLLRNQREWPLQDWRVEKHGDELIEWHRWAKATDA